MLLESFLQFGIIVHVNRNKLLTMSYSSMELISADISLIDYVLCGLIRNHAGSTNSRRTCLRLIDTSV